MTNWKTYRLDELVTFQRGHDLTVSDIVPGPYLVGGSNGPIGSHKAFTTKGPGLTIGRSGNSIGTAHYYEHDFWAHNTTLYVKKFHNSHPKFIYYLLQTLDFSGHNSGSAVPSLNRNFINPIEVQAPDYKTQALIAEILSALDDKIKLNRQMTQTLEEMAKLLFKDMCQPKADEWLEGWRVLRLVDVLDIVMGQSPSGESYNQNKQGIIFYQGKTEFGFRFPGIDKYTTEPKRYARKYDTLLSVRAPVGTINMANEDCCIGRGLAAVRDKKERWSFAFYLMLSLGQSLDKYNGEGTVFGSINKSDLEKMEVRLPIEAEIDLFNDKAKPLDDLVLSYESEIKTLTAIRDSLLPKLMSGELLPSELKEVEAIL